MKQEFKLFTITLLATASVIVIGSFVLMKLWNWNVVGLFGLDPIGLLQSAGVFMVIRFALSGGPYRDTKAETEEDIKKESKEVLKKLRNYTQVSSLFLLIGYIIHLLS